MIFKIFKIRSEVKDFKQDPHKYAGKQMSDLLKGILFIPAMIFFVVLVLLFLGGFTEVFGDDSGLARFFFILFFILFFPIFSIFWKMIRGSRKMTEDASRSATNQFVKMKDSFSKDKEIIDIEVKDDSRE